MPLTIETFTQAVKHCPRRDCSVSEDNDTIQCSVCGKTWTLGELEAAVKAEVVIQSRLHAADLPGTIDGPLNYEHLVIPTDKN